MEPLRLLVLNYYMVMVDHSIFIFFWFIFQKCHLKLFFVFHKSPFLTNVFTIFKKKKKEKRKEKKKGSLSYYFTSIKLRVSVTVQISV